MRCRLGSVAPLFLALLAVSGEADAQPLEIRNPHGGVTVEVVEGQKVRAWREGIEPGETRGILASTSPARILVEAQPPEDQSPDIRLEIPLGLGFSVQTYDGDIEVRGMVRRVSVQSLGGALTLDVPLEVTQLNLQLTERPALEDIPSSHGLRFISTALHPRSRIWRLSNRSPDREDIYGMVTGQLHRPAALSIRDWQFPEDWPLKPHTHSRDAVERLMDSAERRRASQSAPRRTVRGPEPSAGRLPDAAGTLTFTSEVRMVSMSVAVSDSAGHPLLGLGKGDFAVVEDGVSQDVVVADPEESPFNMAILLDLSGSTSVDLEHIRQATLRLIKAAGPRDRVSVYAMAFGMCQRLVALTSDRDELVGSLRRLPYPGGGSPLWDTVVLVYDAELAGRAGERNALVIISDGIDNRISGQSNPSTLRASRLIQASEEMDARIYPIFLLSGQRFGRNWSAKARDRLEALAERTGGRLFPARSVSDIEPVLPALAREMRSVYELAYYPGNQDFNSAWRRVRIKVGVPGARVRARPGYFAD